MGGGERIYSPPPPLPLLEALNRHPLSVFLLANLLTGAVNLSIDTMDVSDGGAAVLLAAYMVVVCAAPFALPRWLSVT